MDRDETQETPTPVPMRGCARAGHPQVMLWVPTSPVPGGHSQPGSSRAWAQPPLILAQLWVHLLLLPRTPPPQPGTARWAPTALEESPKSICRFPIALIMAMMDWMVLL